MHDVFYMMTKKTSGLLAAAGVLLFQSQQWQFSSASPPDDR